MRSSIRTWWLLAAFLSGMAVAMLAEELILSTHDNRLEFSTPVDFLRKGEPLSRLRNAAEVPFLIQTTVWSGSKNHMFRHAEDRFVVSFDLWEETYSVATLKAPAKSRAHLTAPAAEKWCIDQMWLDISGLSNTEPLWTRLEIRAEDTGKDGGLFGRGQIGESGISLTSLIEVFSKPARPQQLHWVFDRGPDTLDQLRRNRGS